MARTEDHILDNFLSGYANTALSDEELRHDVTVGLATTQLQGFIENGIVKEDGAEYYFLQTFLEYTELTDDADDLLIAFRDFYSMRGQRFPEFAEQVPYIKEVDLCLVGVKIYFLRLFIALLYGGVKCNDAYSISVLKVLYQTYYKREYKVLKKFPKLTMDDLMQFNDADELYNEVMAHNPDCEPLPWSKEAVSRALCMAKVYNIDTSECIVAHTVLYVVAKKEKDEMEVMLQEECDEVFENTEDEGISTKQLNEFLQKYDYDDLPLFNDVANLFKHFGYDAGLDTGFWNTAVMEIQSPATTVVNTYQHITRHKFHTDASWEDLLQLLSPYFVLARHISDDTYVFGGLINAILQIPDDKQQSSILRTAGHLYKEKKDKKEKKPENKKSLSSIVQAATAEIRKEDAEAKSELEKLKEENKSLRERLKAAESDYAGLREQYEEGKEERKELDLKLTEANAEHEELIRLRNFVYKETEEEEEEDSVSYNEMKKALSDKAVLIIGGNENWVKKIRNEFPKWKFVAANVSPTVSNKILKTCDKVYFFTDTLGHSNYAKFVNQARIYGKDFSYMHGVNLQKNARQVYDDFYG